MVFVPGHILPGARSHTFDYDSDLLQVVRQSGAIGQAVTHDRGTDRKYTQRWAIAARHASNEQNSKCRLQDSYKQRQKGRDTQACSPYDRHKKHALVTGRRGKKQGVRRCTIHILRHDDAKSMYLPST